MTLNQAMAAINAGTKDGVQKIHYLACGFEPLHLATFFHASLIERLGGDYVGIQNGVYGDLRGNLELAVGSPAIAAAVVIEWSDIDPRLGLRSSGGWSAESKRDITATSEQRLVELEAAIEKLAGRMPVAVAGPFLPLPPIGNTIQIQASVIELELEQQLAAFLLRISKISGVRVVQRNVQRNVQRDVLTERFDPRMELLAGFPYTSAFACELAKCLTGVLYQKAPKKGLITDLDDTLWSGIVGEIGIENVSWQLESHTQQHGLYQQMLGHLADCGVLIGVCSRNEASTAEAALARPDLFLKAESLFPVYANWGSKSASVARILSTWNIGADSVVFIDDNPMELEEVKQAFPLITCLLFPGKNPNKVWSLLGELRDLFGKPVLTEEDTLRQASVRTSARLQDMGAEAAGSPEFLGSLDGRVTISWHVDSTDKRPLELINKTNQFNLNGKRVGEGEWHLLAQAPGAVVAVVSYQDKFGPLGKVAVLLGSAAEGQATVSNWVMSCRAFSRRLEHHTLNELFRRSNADEIHFDFEVTDRNQPLQRFFESIGVAPDDSAKHSGKYRLSRTEFLSRSGILPHQVSNLN